jgi:hypothetical protein
VQTPPVVGADCTGHQVECADRNLQQGPVSARAPNQGMPKARSTARLIESSPGVAQHASSYYESMHASQGRLSKIQFSVFNGKDPQL